MRRRASSLRRCGERKIRFPPDRRDTTRASCRWRISAAESSRCAWARKEGTSGSLGATAPLTRRTSASTFIATAKRLRPSLSQMRLGSSTRTHGKARRLNMRCGRWLGVRGQGLGVRSQGVVDKGQWAGRLDTGVGNGSCRWMRRLARSTSRSRSRRRTSCRMARNTDITRTTARAAMSMEMANTKSS